MSDTAGDPIIEAITEARRTRDIRMLALTHRADWGPRYGEAAAKRVTELEGRDWDDTLRRRRGSAREAA